MKRIIGNLEQGCFVNLDFIVLSNYFTSKVDPQSNVNRVSNDDGYIKEWYESILKNDLNAVVFHDNLGKEFIDRFQTEKIKFIRCQLGQMSLNDERFFIFREFLGILNDNCYILITDINDVVINKSPLEFISKLSNKICLGRDEYFNWRSCSWGLNKLLDFKVRSNIEIPPDFLLFPIFNAGLIGGHVSVLKIFLNRMADCFLKVTDSGNYNMMVLNWVVFNYYTSNFSIRLLRFFPFQFLWKINDSILNGKLYPLKPYMKEFVMDKDDGVFENEFIYSGFPFCSLFKRYETVEVSSAYLIHK